MRLRSVVPVIVLSLVVLCLDTGCQSTWTSFNRFGATVDNIRVGQREIASQPIKTGIAFPATTGDLHIGFRANKLIEPDTFTVVVSHSGPRGSEPISTQTVRAGGTRDSATLSLVRPASGWNQGAYRIEIFLGNALLGKSAFVIGNTPDRAGPASSPQEHTTPPEHGKILYSQDVIANPGQAATIHCTRHLALHLPASIAGNSPTLTVTSLAMAPDSLPDDFTLLAAFDISLGDVERSPDPILLRLKRPDLPADTHVVGITWDIHENRWMPVPTTRTPDGSFEITTHHLSRWGWLRYVQHHKRESNAYYVRKSTHFTIYLDKTCAIPESLIPKDPAAFKPIRVFQADAPAMSIQEIRGRIYLELLADALETAHATFRQNFQVPQHITVTAKYVKDPYWKSLTPHQSIVIAANACTRLLELRQDVGHEIFHCIENQTERLSTMIYWWWLMEAAADYAGDRVAWSGCGPRRQLASEVLVIQDFPRRFRDAWATTRTGLMGEGMSRSFVGHPITLQNKSHEYHTSRLLEYLCDSPHLTRTGEFESLWHSFTKTGATANDLVFLSTWSRVLGPGSLGSVYPKFSAFTLLSKDSPVKNRDNGGELPMPRRTDGKGFYLITADEPDTHTFSLPSPMTTHAIALRPHFTAEDKQNRVNRKDIRITMGRVPDPSSGARVECFLIPFSPLPKLREGQPKPDAVIGADGESFAVLTVPEKHLVYVLVTNTDLKKSLTTTLTASLAGTGVLDLVHHKTTIGLYKFRIKPDDVPDASNLEYRWDFGNRSKKTTTRTSETQHTFTQPGVHTIKVTAHDKRSGDILTTASVDLPIAAIHFAVIDAETRSSIPHGSLTLKRDGGNTYTTVFGADQWGRGSFVGAAPGTYTWNVRAKQYHPQTATGKLQIDPVNGDTSYRIRVALTRIKEPPPRRARTQPPTRPSPSRKTRQPDLPNPPRPAPPSQPPRKPQTAQTIRDDYARRIQALKDEGNAILNKILAYLRSEIEKKPIMWKCPNGKCGDGGPHPWMQYLNGWECRKCIITLRPQKDHPTPHGTHNSVHASYFKRIKALEAERDAKLKTAR